MMTEYRPPLLRNSRDMMQELFDEINGFIEDQTKATRLFPVPPVDNGSIVNTHSNNISTNKESFDQDMDLSLESAPAPPVTETKQAFIRDYHTEGGPPLLPPEHSYDDSLDKDTTEYNTISRNVLHDRRYGSDNQDDDRGPLTTTTTTTVNFLPLKTLPAPNDHGTNQQHEIAEPDYIPDTLSYRSPRFGVKQQLLDEPTPLGPPFLTPSQRVGEAHTVVLRTCMARDVGSHEDRINAYVNAYSHCIRARTHMASWIKNNYTNGPPDLIMQYAPRPRMPSKTGFSFFKRHPKIEDQPLRCSQTASTNCNDVPKSSVWTEDSTMAFPQSSQRLSVTNLFNQNCNTQPSLNLATLPSNHEETSSSNEIQKTNDELVHQHQRILPLISRLTENQKSPSPVRTDQSANMSLYTVNLDNDAPSSSLLNRSPVLSSTEGQSTSILKVNSPLPTSLPINSRDQQLSPSNVMTALHQGGSQFLSSLDSAPMDRGRSLSLPSSLRKSSSFFKQQKGQYQKHHRNYVSPPDHLIFPPPQHHYKSQSNPHRSSSNIDMRSMYNSGSYSNFANRTLYRTRSNDYLGAVVHDRPLLIENRRRHVSYQHEPTSQYHSVDVLIPHRVTASFSKQYRRPITDMTSESRHATDLIPIPTAKRNLFRRSMDGYTNQGNFFEYPVVRECDKRRRSVPHSPNLYTSSKHHPTMRYSPALNNLNVFLSRIPKHVLSYYLQQAHGDFYLAKELCIDDIIPNRI